MKKENFVKKASGYVIAINSVIVPTYDNNKRMIFLMEYNNQLNPFEECKEGDNNFSFILTDIENNV
jgi:hypothetical protein